MNIKMCVQVSSVKLYHSEYTRYRIKSIIDYPHDICLIILLYVLVIFAIHICSNL